MKKLVFTLLALGLLTGLFSCSENFEVSAPYKHITFVYGFLNPKDTAHYIRIQKGFLDENKSAIDMAKVADSSFYNSLSVKVKEVSANNTVISTDSLVRVDLANEGYPKDSGGFFNTPSYAYKFKKSLNANNKYRLVITNTATGDVDSSEINIIDDTKFAADGIFSNLYKIRFSKTVPTDVQKYQVVVTIAPNVKYLEAIIRFHWIEKNLNAGTTVRKSADFMVESKPTTKNFPQQEVIQSPTIRFYSFLRDVMQPAPAGVNRYLDSCDLYIYSGGIDYFKYIEAKSIQSGLTADQAKPVFTNIYGTDVYGLFSTRTQIIRTGIPVDTASLDSLMVHSITKDLNIKGFSDE